MSPRAPEDLRPPVRPPLRRPVRTPGQVMAAVSLALVLRELKTRLGGHWWGLLWTLGEPLAAAAVMLAVYATLKAQTLAGVDTLMFLLAGLLPFQLFKSIVLRGMDGIDANQGLLAYRQVRPVDAVLSRTAVEVALAVGVTAAALAVAAWLGHDVLPQRPLELLACSALLVGLGTAAALIAATLTAGALARARAVVRVGFLPLYLASGVLFPLSALPQAAREWLMLNPVAQLVEGLRSAFFGDSYRPALGLSAATMAAWVLVAVPLALALYRLRRDHLQPA
jgi:capsular polysaccharide transport system permease protein